MKLKPWMPRSLPVMLALGASSLQAQAYQEPVVRPQRLCLYYGWPSYVNGSQGDLTNATAQFTNCDVVVLGDGIEHPTHPDNFPAAQIISALTQQDKKVFGYVDLGVSTQNLSEAQMQQYADEWRAIGASGIFLDDAGFDYNVTRARQNAIVDYVHQLGMPVFMNAWNIDDALGDADEAQRPNPPRLTAGDWYLAESWLVAGGAYQPLGEWSLKADKALAYMRSKGVSIAAVTTAGANKAYAGDYKLNKFKMGWWGAAMYNLAAWQWTDVGYSSGNDKLNFYDTGSYNYGTLFVDAGVTHQNNSKNTSAPPIPARFTFRAVRARGRVSSVSPPVSDRQLPRRESVPPRRRSPPGDRR